MVEPVRHRQTKEAATDMFEPKAAAPHLDSTATTFVITHSPSRSNRRGTDLAFPGNAEAGDRRSGYISATGSVQNGGRESPSNMFATNLGPGRNCGFRGLRPWIPIERDHAVRSKAATCSDEGGRGIVAGIWSGVRFSWLCQVWRAAQ